MTARHLIYRALQHPDIVAEIGGAEDPRIFAKKTMTSSIEDTPFIVYKLGNESTEEFSEDRDISRQFLQVWVHDYTDGKVADYDRIDRILAIIRREFRRLTSADDGSVWQVRYLETSADLDDDTLNTVFRYLRFQVIKEERS